MPRLLRISSLGQLPLPILLVALKIAVFRLSTYSSRRSLTIKAAISSPSLRYAMTQNSPHPCVVNTDCSGLQKSSSNKNKYPVSQAPQRFCHEMSSSQIRRNTNRHSGHRTSMLGDGTDGRYAICYHYAGLALLPVTL